MTSKLLIEFGFEELPASYVTVAEAYFAEVFKDLFSKERLGEADIKVYGTPRRIACIANGFLAKQSDRSFEVTGPKVDVAYNDVGELTKAALGFLKGRGARPEDAYKKSTKKGEVLAAEVTEVGQTAEQILKKHLPSIASKCPWPKTMRWDESGFRAARPLRWLCVLLDDQPVDITIGAVTSSGVTYGHRFHNNRPIEVTTESYVEDLKTNRVAVEAQTRMSMIQSQAASRCPDDHRLQDDIALLEEVANLIEWPHLVVGQFDEKYLKLPERLLLCEMNQHQRYFGIYDSSGALAPYFAAVSGSVVSDDAALAEGFGHVAIARFEDARFYFESDQKAGVAQLKKKSNQMIFHRDLGTIDDKLNRLVGFIKRYGIDYLGDEMLATQLVETIPWLKFDLSSGVVGEFPELQGYIGRQYITMDVSNTRIPMPALIESHHLPAGRETPLPESLAGRFISLLDKMDSFCGFASIGKLPKGSSDPFGLRRLATSIIRLARQLGDELPKNEPGFGYVNLELLIGQIYAQYEIDDRKLAEQCLRFLRERIPSVLGESGTLTEFIQAAQDSSHEKGARFSVAIQAKNVRALEDVYQEDPTTFAEAAGLFKRIGNIIRKSNMEGASLQDESCLSSLKEEAELHLNKQVEAFHHETDFSNSKETIFAAVRLRDAINAFFDSVMVMDDNEALRLARLTLLNRILMPLENFADFSKLQDLAKRVEKL